MSDFSKAQKRRAWGVWALLFVPSFIAILFGIEAFGFSRVFPVILIVLVAVLLHQRYIKKRSWQAILWGEKAARG